METKSGNSGKFKRLNLAHKRDILEKVCRGQNLQNLKPEGPYGAACTLLKIKNTHTNRKRVQTFWLRHYKLNASKLKKEALDNSVTGPKRDIKNLKSVHTDASKGQSYSKKRQAESLPTTSAKRSKCENETPCKAQSQSEAPTFSLKFGKPISRTKAKQAKTSTKEFCICGANKTNWEENGDMAECEACHQWYHFKCISKKNIKVARKADVKFICGLKTCTFKESFLMVKGTIYQSNPEVLNIDFGLDSKEPVKDIKENEKETLEKNSSASIKNSISENNQNSDTCSPNEGTLKTDNKCEIEQSTFLKNVNLVSTNALKEKQKHTNLSYPLRSRRLRNNLKEVTAECAKKKDKTSNHVEKSVENVLSQSDTVDRQAEHDAMDTAELFVDSLKQKEEVKKNSNDSKLLKLYKKSCISEKENASQFVNENVHQSGLIATEQVDLNNKELSNAFSEHKETEIKSEKSERIPNDLDEKSKNLTSNKNARNKVDEPEETEINCERLERSIEGDQDQQSEKSKDSSKTDTNTTTDFQETEKIKAVSENSLKDDNNEQSDFFTVSESLYQSLDELSDTSELSPLVDSLRKIFDEIDELISRSANFQYTVVESEKEYIYLEEMLTQKLEALDSLQLKNSKMLCMQRKNMIYLINYALSKMEKSKQQYLKNVAELKSQPKNPSSSLADDNISCIENEKVLHSEEKPNVPATDPNQFNLSENETSQTNENVISQEMKNDEEQYLFSPETISSVLGIDLPKDNFFRFDLPDQCTYPFPADIWQSLCKTKTKRCFKRNSWQDHFLKGLKESNPHCVFTFKHHRVSDAKQRQKQDATPFFYAEGSCKFKGCGVAVKLEMWKLFTVTVKYSKSVKHIIGEQHHRNITGEKRDELKKQSMYGIKPLPQFLKEHEKLSPDQLLSGNRDGLGKNSRIFAQIASEARQLGRYDSELVKSLLFQKENMQKEMNGGFIQKVCASPLYVLYWSNYGLDIYNDRAKHDTLFWDAAGSIVRKGDKGKQFLYYELAAKHPVKGKMGIPLTSMVSEDQSLPVIYDWLHSFRHAVKKRFGHSRSVLFPKMIISDQAMVFILAAMKEFNGENMEFFLKRAWNIVNGRFQFSDTQKTLIHLCASHFMNGVKRFLKKKDTGSQKKHIFLYMTGLLMNCQTLSDAEEILLDIFTVLSSRTLNDKNKTNYDRLMRKINNYETKAENLETITKDSDKSDSPVNPDLFTEEEFQIVGSASPFKEWATSVQEEALRKSESDSEGSTNPYFSETFSQHLIKKLMPIFPLWSSILTGDLSRHSATSPVLEEHGIVTEHPPKTNSIIENRFRILKYIHLNNRSQHRIDEFSELLKDETVSIQKFAVSESLQSRAKSPVRKRKRFPSLESFDSPVKKSKKSPKKNTLLEEGWGKCEEQPLNLKSKVGKYQQAPKHKINTIVIDAENPSMESTSNSNECKSSTENVKLNDSKSETKLPRKGQNSKTNRSKVTDSFWHLKNLGMSCWFNSMLQAFLSSDMSARLIEHFSDEGSVTDLVESTNLDKAVKSVAKLWEYMISNDSAGKRVPEQMLQTALRNVCTAIPGFTQNVMQDAQEMDTYIMGHISNLLLDNIDISQTEFCLSCDKQTIRDENEGHTIHLNLLPGLSGISVQTLIDNHFSAEEEICRQCNSCEKDCTHKMSKIVKNCPKNTSHYTWPIPS